MEELTPEERRLVEEMAQVCHEELVKGVPPKVVAARCNRCRKCRATPCTCEVYPEWIPDKVFTEGCPDFEEQPGPLYTPEMFELMKALAGENPERLKRLQEKMRPDYRMYGEKGPEA